MGTLDAQLLWTSKGPLDTRLHGDDEGFGAKSSMAPKTSTPAPMISPAMTLPAIAAPPEPATFLVSGAVTVS